MQMALGGPKVRCSFLGSRQLLWDQQIAIQAAQGNEINT